MLVSTHGELPALLLTATGALASAAPVAAVPVNTDDVAPEVPPPPPPPHAAKMAQSANADSLTFIPVPLKNFLIGLRCCGTEFHLHVRQLTKY
jgi:hypothetical protein